MTMCCAAFLDPERASFNIDNNPNEVETYLRWLGCPLKNIVKGNPVFPGIKNAKEANFSMHVARPKR